MAMSRVIDDLAYRHMNLSEKLDAKVSLQRRVTEWREACHGLFNEEVAKTAAKLVEERLAGPYTHRYKGVAVTEEQFWLLMKAEGFERPED